MQKWQELRRNDELTRQIEEGNAFSGFSDALNFERDIVTYGFLPTFKMQRGRRYGVIVGRWLSLFEQ